MTPLRSWLFVPGNRERFLDRLDSLRPDAVILDLEDSIPPGEKIRTRAAVRAVLRSERLAGQRLFVRVNDFRTGLAADDLEAVVSNRLAGIFLPKIEQVDELREANRLLALAEAAAGLAIGSSRIIPIVETVRGIVRVAELAGAGKRILGLNFGYDDFTLDLEVARSRDGLETLYPRSRIAISARAAGVEAIDGPLADFGDLEALEAECRVSRQLGFTGKQCIHPSQIEPVNRAFSPTEQELAQARAVIAAYEEAVQHGHGSARLGESMIDTPVVERARRLLAKGEATRDADGG